MAVRPNEVKNRNLSDSKRDSVVAWLESEIDNQLKSRGLTNGLFRYDATIFISDHEYDALLRLYTNAGWIVMAEVKVVSTPGPNELSREIETIVLTPQPDAGNLSLEVIDAVHKIANKKVANECRSDCRVQEPDPTWPAHHEVPAKPVANTPPAFSRELAAAMAMQALITANKGGGWCDNQESYVYIATTAVGYADALIAAINQPQTSKKV